MRKTKGKNHIVQHCEQNNSPVNTSLLTRNQSLKERGTESRVLKENSYQPRILYPVKRSIKNESEMKTLPGERKLKELGASTFAL